MRDLMNALWWWNWRRRFRRAALLDLRSRSGTLSARRELARRINVEMRMSDAQREELLPCPFCGGMPAIFASSDHSTAWEGGCGNEDCKMQPQVWELDEATAIAAWNRRASPDEHLLRQAAEALEKSYDATEWPADGTSLQEQVAAALRQRIGRG